MNSSRGKEKKSRKKFKVNEIT